MREIIEDDKEKRAASLSDSILVRKIICYKA
nr:MAG TPA: hypothetical protein [Caudoviricetes sp.]